MKKLQNEGIKLESEFYREVHALECKYAAQYASLFDKVSQNASVLLIFFTLIILIHTS